MKSKLYVLVSLSFFLILIAGVSIFNFVSDPWDIYQYVRVDGFNAFKSKLFNYSRLSKPLRIESGEYQHIVFGSSRVEYGVPAINGITGDGDRSLNAAFHSASIKEIADVFRHSTLVSPVRDVVIGLDFYMFSESSEKVFPYNEILAQYNDEFSRRFNKIKFSLLNADALKASFDTVRKQKEKHNKYYDTGQVNTSQDALEASENGYMHFDDFSKGFMSTTWTNCSNNIYSYGVGESNTMVVFHSLLVNAAEKNVRVNFFIAPIHANLLNAIDAVGLWSAYEQWKRDLIAAIDLVTKEYPDAKINLWDFSGYHKYSTEKIPDSPSVYMKWYLDSSHFTDALGKLILYRIYSKKGADKGFGVLLKGGNIEKHLQVIRDAKRIYQLEHIEYQDLIIGEAKNIIKERSRSGVNCVGKPNYVL